MDLILFPTDKYYSYLKEYIKKQEFENPIYVGYDFNKAEKVEFGYENETDSELRLKIALEYMQKFCEENKEKEIRVYLYTPDISYYYEELDIRNYMCSNIVKLNYCVKECGRMWCRDFDKIWLEDKKFFYIDL